MQNRTLEIGVDLFLLAGILALLLLALRVSGLSASPSSDTYKVYAYFDNIAGLTVRAKVTMAGVTIGKVTAIDLDRDSYTGRVTLQLDKSVDNLPTDSTASILTAGLLGEKYIEAVRQLSASPNAKIVVLPADLPAAVRGIMSALGK